MLCTRSAPVSVCRVQAPRSRVVACRANQSAQPTRRETLKAAILVLPALATLRAAEAQAMDLANHRSAKSTIDRMDHARDSDVDSRERFSLQDTTKLTLADHKARAAESLSRLQTDVKEAADKNQWPRVSADLRHQLGTLRYDLQTLINSQSDKAARKQGMEMHDKAMNALAELDLYARKNDATKASESLQTAVAALTDVVSFLG